MIRMKMIFAVALAVIGLGMGLRGTPAFGDVTYFLPVTGFQDDDLEWFEDNDGNNVISDGDRLYGVLELNETFSVVPAGSSADIAPSELTGVFDLTVSSVVGNVITFEATAADGTAVSLYLDNVDDLDTVGVNCTSDVDCIDKADNGSLYLTLGFAGDADESWTAIVGPGGLSPDTVADGAANSLFGLFNYFLSIMENNTGLNFGLQDCSTSGCTGGDGFIQVIGSGTILGGQGLTNGAFARSDTDAQVAPIPEPSTLLLLGAGLLGLGSFARRRMKK